MDSESISTKLIIDDERVVKFYNKHKNLDINSINLKIIELIENLIPYGTNNIGESDIINSMSKLWTEIDNLKKNNAVFMENYFDFP